MRTKLGGLAVVLSVVWAAVPALAAEEGSPQGEWATEVHQKIQAAEYEVSWQDGRYQAPNRAQGFRTLFTEEGIHAVPRIETEETTPWEWGLRWIGYGRPGRHPAPVPPATLAPDAARIEYRRGPFTEWYENRPEGLKQGFLLPMPPRGTPSEGPVYLELALLGSLSPSFSEDGQAIDFLGAEGRRVLRYAQLLVTDARGEVVPSRMEGFSRDGVRGIRLVLDDRDAVYPLTVDPLTFSPVWTNESNQASAEFGESVGTAGDVNGDGYSDVIVGAPFYDNGQTDEGRAYLYLGSASGLVASPAWFVESDQAGARLGWSVATAGDVNGDGYSDVVVGAPRYDNGQTDEGRVFVYLGSASGLSPTFAWSDESDQSGAQLGTSVAPAADANGDGFADVLAGAPLYDNDQVNEGRAFLWLGSPSGLLADPSWTAEGNQASVQFGWSVATAGDTNADGYADVLVGAPLHDNGQVDEGRAYLYFGSPSGPSTTFNWFQEGNQIGAQFGYSVATAGDVDGAGYSDVLVGAWQYDNGQLNEGRAFLYLGGAFGPPNFAISTIENNVADAGLGWSVGSAGDVNGDGFADVVVTAPLYFTSPTEGGGEVRVYLGAETGLKPLPVWFHVRTLANAAYGWSAATAGDVNGDGYADLIVGAPWDDNGQSNEGIAYVYHGSADWLSGILAWTESNQADASLGMAVATAGDVNGDGYADVLVGAPFYDGGLADEGKVFLFTGSATGLVATLWHAEGEQAGARFGASVSTAGDTNGDGFDDVVVGAPLFDGLQPDDGKAFLYQGGAGALAAAPSWATEGGVSGMGYGEAVATAGDVNGDGFADVLVGAPQFTQGQAQEGGVFLFPGSATGLSPVATWSAQADQANARLGRSVSSAGDVNGDGFADVIVGAPQFDGGQSFEGKASVYLGSASGPAASPAWSVEGGASSASLGTSVAAAGDVNGDGYGDVIVGVPGFFNPWVALFHGGPLGLPAVASSTIVSGGDPGSQYGVSVAGAGDVNGDGYADVVVGAPLYLNEGMGGQIFGYALVYFGSATGISTLGSAALTSNVSGDRFGRAVGAAGDFNGDGYADVVVGAPFFSNGQASEGRAFLFHGGGAEGIALNPRQRRSDGTGLIPRHGLSDSSAGFRLAARGRTPFGRGKVRLEWEVKPFGTPLDGTGTAAGTTSVDTGLTGGEIEEEIAGLPPNTRHHWRLRLLYDKATTPYAVRSRWVTVPWGGWNEAMLRTDVSATPAGRATSFVITKVGGGVTISWLGTGSCLEQDDHAIYEGTIGDFTSHVPVTCEALTNSWNFTPQPGNRYFLLVPLNASREGSYGLDGDGNERPVSAAACHPQAIAACP